MLFWYNAFLFLSNHFAPFILCFSAKGRSWLKGQAIAKASAACLEHKDDAATIWMHCASVGEYEQGKPILRAMKNTYPRARIVLTFFSPSAFTLPANFFIADEVRPLVLDGKQEAREWIRAIHPNIALFVQQEFWFHYLHELNLQKIPVFLISGTISSSFLLRLPFYKNWYLNMTQFFTLLFLQSNRDMTAATSYGLKNTLLAGNTRVDSVAQNRTFQWEHKELAAFTENSCSIIFGSVYREDFPFLIHFLRQPMFEKWKIIWAPHDISSQHMAQLRSAIPLQESLQFLSKYDKQNLSSRILVLDSFGILKYAYRYSRIAYVGGGFGKGIHNILEPVVYQIPVIFGPKHQAFPEAGSLIEMKGGFCISHLKDWDAILRKLHPTAFRQQCGVNASSYIAENMGTTEKILPYLFTALDHHEQGSYA